MSDIKIVKIKGKLMWPKLFHPDTRYDEKWTTDILLDAEGIKAAREDGLRIKVNPKYKDQFDGYDGSFIRMDRPVLNPSTKEEREGPVVKDAKVRDVSPDTGIGNGTDAMCRAIVKTRNKDGKEMSPTQAQKEYGGYGLFLTGVQIVNLVPYERNSDPDVDFVEEDGSFEGGKDSTGGFKAVNTGDDPFDGLGAGTLLDAG